MILKFQKIFITLFLDFHSNHLRNSFYLSKKNRVRIFEKKRKA